MDQITAPERYGLGGNNPPELMVPSVGELKDYLLRDTEGLRTRGDRLAPMLAKFLAEVTSILDDEGQRAAADVVAQIEAHVANIEDRRTLRKQPWLDGGRTVDAFFKEEKNRFDAVSSIKKMQAAYAVAVEEMRRAEAQRIADEARVRADRLAEEAAENLNSANLDAAEAAAEAAWRAEQEASASPAEFSRVRSDYGVTASLRSRLQVEVTDWSKVPHDLLALNESEAKARYNQAKKNGVQNFEIPGLRFSYVKSIQNRA